MWREGRVKQIKPCREGGEGKTEREDCEAAALGFAIVGSAIGVFLWWRARPLRGRVATVWSSRSVLRPSRDDDEREEMIMELSLLMQQATDDLRHGQISRSVYERVWMAVYEETYALADGDQPSKSQQ